MPLSWSFATSYYTKNCWWYYVMMIIYKLLHKMLVYGQRGLSKKGMGKAYSSYIIYIYLCIIYVFIYWDKFVYLHYIYIYTYICILFFWHSHGFESQAKSGSLSEHIQRCRKPRFRAISYLHEQGDTDDWQIWWVIS